MMKKIILLLNLALCILAAEQSPAPVSYENHQLYSLQVDTSEQLDLIQRVTNEEQFPSFKHASSIGDSIEFLIAPERRSEFARFVKENGFRGRLVVDNFQRLIDAEKPAQNPLQTEPNEIDWRNYYRYATIQQWLIKMATENYDNSQYISVGNSLELRRIDGIRISSKSGNQAIVIESGIHAREWVAPATATYIIHQLLTSDDPRVVDARTNIDWYIIPCMNPDGYEWTHTNDRMWRKNRNLNGYPANSSCVGIDLNRNYAHTWNLGGSSTDPCTNTYHGSGPASEPEVQAMSTFYENVANQTTLFLAFHSYGKLILHPWAHQSTPKIRETEHMQVGAAAAKAIAAKHTTEEYRVGSSFDTLYASSGGSRDHMVGKHDVPLGYVFEMRDNGAYGFVMPPEEILANCEEIFEGILAMIDEARKLGYFPIVKDEEVEENRAFSISIGSVFALLHSLLVVFLCNFLIR